MKTYECFCTEAVYLGDRYPVSTKRGPTNFNVLWHASSNKGNPQAVSVLPLMLLNTPGLLSRGKYFAGVFLRHLLLFISILAGGSRLH